MVSGKYLSLSVEAESFWEVASMCEAKRMTRLQEGMKDMGGLYY